MAEIGVFCWKWQQELAKPCLPPRLSNYFWKLVMLLAFYFLLTVSNLPIKPIKISAHISKNITSQFSKKTKSKHFKTKLSLQQFKVCPTIKIIWNTLASLILTCSFQMKPTEVFTGTIGQFSSILKEQKSALRPRQKIISKEFMKRNWLTLTLAN